MLVRCTLWKAWSQAAALMLQEQCWLCLPSWLSPSSLLHPSLIPPSFLCLGLGGPWPEVDSAGDSNDSLQKLQLRKTQFDSKN
jgi:hypothetical protein